VAFYREFRFPVGAVYDVRDVSEGQAENRATDTGMYHRTASGTAIVIHRTPSQVALVTSAHVVAFPDTVVSYHISPENDRSIRSLSVKVRQANYVPDVPGADRMEVLVLDEDRDVALLGQAVPDLPAGSVPVIDFPVGTVRDLQWGSEVYVFGYPAGTRMMTRALVSKTSRERKYVFLTDANFNRGFSGGLVLAVRDGLPHFEWVGIATASAASTEVTVVPPDSLKVIEDDLERLYEGPLVLRQTKRLSYGITTCTTVDAIVDVLRDNAAYLSSRGYTIDLAR